MSGAEGVRVQLIGLFEISPRRNVVMSLSLDEAARALFPFAAYRDEYVALHYRPGVAFQAALREADRLNKVWQFR